jgi:phage-related protein
MHTIARSAMEIIHMRCCDWRVRGNTCSVVGAGSNGGHDMEKLEAFVDECSTLEGMLDAVIAQDSLQTQNIWAIRDGMAEAVVKHGR